MPRPALAALLWLGALYGGHRAGGAYAARIPIPREAAPDAGARFIPARDRLATALRPELVAADDARKILGRGPRGALVSLRMDYPHPDTGEPRRNVLYYETEGDLDARLRREVGGYAGPAARAWANALRRQGAAAAAARMERLPNYRVEAGINLSLRVERRLSSVADAYHRRAQRGLTVTSGTRDAEAQARAMHVKLELGDDVVKLYRDRPEVHEIIAAYDAARRENRNAADVRRAMAETIRAQVARGDYISNHLRAGAVDIRSRDMTARHKDHLRAAAREIPGVSLYEERLPPHFHMQVHDPEP